MPTRNWTAKESPLSGTWRLADPQNRWPISNIRAETRFYLFECSWMNLRVVQLFFKWILHAKYLRRCICLNLHMNCMKLHSMWQKYEFRVCVERKIVYNFVQTTHLWYEPSPLRNLWRLLKTAHANHTKPLTSNFLYTNWTQTYAARFWYKISVSYKNLNYVNGHYASLHNLPDLFYLWILRTQPRRIIAGQLLDTENTSHISRVIRGQIS